MSLMTTIELMRHSLFARIRTYRETRSSKNWRLRAGNRKRLIHKLQVVKEASPAIEKAQTVSVESEKSEVVKEASPAIEKAQTVSVEREKSEVEKQADRHIVLSLTALGLTAAGQVFFSPFTLVGAGCMLYLWYPLSKTAYHKLVKKRQLSVEVVDSFLTPIALLMGYYRVMALAFVLYYGSEKVLLKTEDNSIKSLINIFGEQPRFVWVLQDGVEVRVPFEEVKRKSVVIVNAGEMIPVDGIITEGIASIDQRILTGESQPVEKEAGERVFASTMVLSGCIYICAEQAGEETVVAQIGKILTQTEDFKEHMRSQAVERANDMVPIRLLVTAASFAVLGPMGGMAVLNARFGYQVRITGPLGMLGFLQIASRQGILVKDGRSLEILSNVDAVVFDKTGTLTTEQPYVGAIYTSGGYERDEVLAYAAAAEYKQTHPIALAILEAAEQQQLTLPPIDAAQYEVGYGIKVSLADRLICVGSGRFMQLEGIAVSAEMRCTENEVHELGHSLVYVAIDQQLCGAIELRPTVRPEAKRIVDYFKQRQIQTYIISGDHQKPTQRLAEMLGIENYFAETLPENKADLVEQLQRDGRQVCFIGDGINDSIALKKANVSISISGASTIATDTAQIVLMDQTLNQLSQAFELADAWKSNMRNLLLASVVPQIVTVGGAFFLGFGLTSSIVLNMMGLSIGVGNAMTPLLQHQIEDRD